MADSTGNRKSVDLEAGRRGSRVDQRTPIESHPPRIAGPATWRLVRMRFIARPSFRRLTPERAVMTQNGRKFKAAGELFARARLNVRKPGGSEQPWRRRPGPAGLVRRRSMR